MRKILAGSTLIGAILFPGSAFAIPCVDAPNLAQNIAKNIMDATAWAQQKGMSLMEMDMNSLLSQMQVDGQNNAFANMIARTGLSRQEIQNLEVAEKSVPPKNACGTVAMAEAQKQLGETQVEYNNMMADQRASESSAIRAYTRGVVKDGQMGGARAVDQARLTLSEEVSNICETLQPPGADVDLDAPMATSLCMRGDLVTGSGTGKVYTPDEASAVEMVNKLIANPLPANPSMFTGTPDVRTVKMARYEAIQNLAYGSLQAVTSWRQPLSGGASAMLALEEDVNNHYDSMQLAKMSNVDPNSKNEELTSAITRRIAAMNALGLKIDTDRFKSELRREALLSAILAIQLSPINE